MDQPEENGRRVGELINMVREQRAGEMFEAVDQLIADDARTLLAACVLLIESDTR